MLQMLRIQRIVLLTNNPTKLDGLARSRLPRSWTPAGRAVNSDNARYLVAKAARAGHRLDHLIGSLAESIDCNAIRTDRTPVTERAAHSATLAETMPHRRKSARTTY